MIPVVIYARYSSDNQREESIEGQVRACTEYALKNDMDIIKVYADRAMSGRNDNRPDYQQMLLDAKKKAFKHVLVWKGDRISRDRFDKAYCRSTLKKYGVTILSVTESIPDGAEGILLESLLDGLAEYYSVNLAQNTLRGMKENALKCKYNGSTIPAGYKVVNKEYVISSKAESEVIKNVFEQYARGDAPSDILAYCAQKGLKNAIGNEMNYSSLRRMIQNQIYKGTYKFADVEIEDGVPSIVSKKLWVEANEMIKENKSKPSNEKWLLSGKLTCGLCGSAIVGDSGTGRNKKYYYYTCNGKKKHKSCNLKSYPKNKLENRIAATLEAVIDSDEFRTELIEALTGAISEWNEDNANTKPLIDNRLKEANKRVKNLTKAIAIGSTSKTVIRELEKAEEEAELLEIEEKKRTINTPINPKEVEYFFIYLKKKKDRDLLLQTLLHHAVIYPDKLEIALNYTLENKRAALVSKDDSQSPELVRMSINWLPSRHSVRTVYLSPEYLLLYIM